MIHVNRIEETQAYGGNAVVETSAAQESTSYVCEFIPLSRCKSSLLSISLLGLLSLRLLSSSCYTGMNIICETLIVQGGVI